VNIEEKYETLKQVLKRTNGAAVALSGGVDSTFLSKVCYDALRDKSMAITVVSPMMPRSEIDDAIEFATSIGITHYLIEENTIEEEILDNPTNRCYFCKKFEFTKILDFAANRGIKYVLDGSNIDDESDYRPGLTALKELEIISPLREAGLSKLEIRELSKRLELKTWNKPSLACLASRIPYGERITPQKLSKIDRAEDYLRKLGFIQFRVRSHGDIARVEVSPEERPKMFDTAMLDNISKEFKEYGYHYVCLDMEGYKTGSLNLALTS